MGKEDENPESNATTKKEHTAPQRKDSLKQTRHAPKRGELPQDEPRAHGSHFLASPRRPAPAAAAAPPRALSPARPERPEAGDVAGRPV